VELTEINSSLPKSMLCRYFLASFYKLSQPFLTDPSQLLLIQISKDRQLLQKRFWLELYQRVLVPISANQVVYLKVYFYELLKVSATSQNVMYPNSRWELQTFL
jgi:hypothetical protein